MEEFMNRQTILKIDKEYKMRPNGKKIKYIKPINYVSSYPYIYCCGTTTYTQPSYYCNIFYTDGSNNQKELETRYLKKYIYKKYLTNL